MGTLIKANQPCPFNNCDTVRGGAYYSDGKKCFMCGMYEPSKFSFDFTTQKAKIMYDELDKYFDFTGKLPKGLIDVPSDKLQWFYLYGITKHMVNAANIKFSEKYNVYVIPCYHKGKLVGYQLKNWAGTFLGKNNKQLKYKTYGKPAYYHYQKDTDRYSDVCIITEDVRSAIKLTRFYDTVAIGGTNLRKEYVNELCSKYNHFLVWLDGDEAGRNGTRKLVDKLKLKAYSQAIGTVKDPKCYSYKELYDLINFMIEGSLS